MNVRLVSTTRSNIQELYLSAEELIVYIARVSNPANQMNNETSDRLLAYLIKNKHWSPFEMVDMTVEIVTSRGIAQQILRHRSFSFQEFSQRYAEATEMESVQLRKQAEKNRQSSAEVYDPLVEDTFGLFEGLPVPASDMIRQVIGICEDVYKQQIKAGVAKECARFILPITTQTKIYMKGSIRSWIHYLQIRTDEHTQLEHRQVALEILKIFRDAFPNISKAIFPES